MSILTKQITFSMSLAGALVVAACSSGVGGGIAGIGGSGYISTGTVTSFGSVFVNGVEFETGSSSFEIEGMSGSQQDLKIGMVVQVSGSINADGSTGTATHIKYGDDLQGPVSNITTGLNTRSFTVLGNNVVISATTTAFEGVLFANIVDGNVVEISGFYDENNQLQASYLELKSASSNADSVFEVKGKLTNLSANQFQVKGVTVDASAANFNGFTQLQNNLLVEVKGTFSNNVLLATEIEADNGLSEDADVEVEGIINRYASLADFDINGLKADASNAQLSPASLIIGRGSKVEIEGRMNNGVLMVSRISAREGSAEVSAVVSGISENSFTVEVQTEQFINITLTRSTRMEDEMEMQGADDNLLLTELRIGDSVSVQGFESAENTITATQVKRNSEAQETEVQGVLSAESNSSFTVLGVTFQVDTSTEYDGADTNAAFLNLTTLDESIISIIVDNKDDAFANEVGLSD